MTKRLDQKLARIRAGKYKPTDFIIADAKDGDMGPSLTSSGPKRAKDGSWARYRTRAEFLDEIRAVVRQDVLDIMLVSASNLELLNKERGITVLCSLHYLDLVHRYASRAIALKDGRLVFHGLPSEIDDAQFKSIYGQEAERVSLVGTA